MGRIEWNQIKNQLSRKFIMLINVKNANNCWHFNIYQHDKYNIREFKRKKKSLFFSVSVFVSSWDFMLSWVEHEKKFYTTSMPGVACHQSQLHWLFWRMNSLNWKCFAWASELGSCQIGDNCIRKFHLGRYIVGYTVENLVKRDFRTYIRRYISPNEKFEYYYPHSNALLTFSLQKDSENVLCCAYTSSGCKLHKTACQLHIFTCQPM